MKITESRIRQYIRQLLMETLYAGLIDDPNNPGKKIPVTMTRDQFEKQPGNKRILKMIPADAPPIDRSYTKEIRNLAKQAKREYFRAKMDLDSVLMDKLNIIAFGPETQDLLDRLSWNEKDAMLLLPEFNQYFQFEKENFNQASSLMHGLGLGSVAEYLEKLMIITDDFSRDESLANYTTLSPNMTMVGGRGPFRVFFRAPDNPNNIGMGESLINLIFKEIMKAITKVQNQTPIEFANQLYPEFETYVNNMFAKNRIIADNVEGAPSIALELEKIRKGYLDSIRYVLIELIAELNFEFLYLGNGMGIKSSDPNQLLLFLPDDESLLDLATSAAASISAPAPGALYRPGNWGEFELNLSEMFRPDSVLRRAPELRSMPSYYNTKFSVNPNFLSIIGKELNVKFNNRLDYNLTTDIGFQNEGISYYDELDGGEISELWKQS